MPRYRFAWDNIPSDIAAALCDHQKPRNVSSCTDTLRAAFGARPKPEFVHETWPILRDRWLAADGESRSNIVSKLQASKLGDFSSPATTAEDQMKYLGTCKNQETLREIVLARFLEIGETSSEVPTSVTSPPAAPAAPTAGPASPQAAQPAQPPQAAQDVGGSPASTDSPATLEAFVEAAMKQLLKQDQVDRDKDGDIVIRAGSTMCFVRSVEKQGSVSFVRIFSPIASELPASPELFQALNDVNLDLTFARMLHTPANEVILAVDLPSAGVSTEQLMVTFDWFANAADYFDTQITKRFGGKKWFEDQEATVNV